MHGTAGSQIRQTSTIDPGTGRLDSHDVATENQNTPGTFDSRFTSGYTYDQVGNITATAGQTNGTTDQVECFTYDQLRRLTQAWTQTTTNCTTPQRTGADPYHRSWTFDATGNRLTQTDHNSTAGATVWTYNVGAAHGVTAHQIAAVTAAGPLADTGTRSFTYDNAGNMTQRTTTTGATQTLTRNPEGRLDTITDGTDTTQYVYDADGKRLISRAPAKTTLYLGGTELELATGSTQPDGTRYYNGYAVRDITGLKWTINNHQGTGQVQIDADTLASQRRRTMPYGENRGTTPTPWRGTKGFVGGTNDDTGLPHLGAREYDPTIGRFASIDPLMDPNDPQQLHGYSYANNNPTTLSDPDGLIPLATEGSAEETNYWKKSSHKLTYSVHKKKWTAVKKPVAKKRPGGECKTLRECSGDLDEKERKAVEAAEEVLRKWGDERKTCLFPGAGVGCFGYDLGRPGPHERAWCRMVGAVTCKIAERAYELADKKLAKKTKKIDAEDPTWNAKHHGLWMAIMVANGVSEKDARMLGVAHEIDAWEPERGLAEMRRDLRNNDIGIAVGSRTTLTKQDIANAWASRGGYSFGDRLVTGGLDSSKTQQAIDGINRALSPSCVGTCFNLPPQ